VRLQLGERARPFAACRRRGCAGLIVFNLVVAAVKAWRKLKGENLLPKIVRGAKFRDGAEIIETSA